MYILGGLSTSVMGDVTSDFAAAVIETIGAIGRKIAKLYSQGKITRGENNAGAIALTGLNNVYRNPTRWPSQATMYSTREALNNFNSALGSGVITPSQFIQKLVSFIGAALGYGTGGQPTMEEIPTAETYPGQAPPETYPGQAPPSPKPPTQPEAPKDKSNLMLIVVGGIVLFVALSVFKKK